MRPVEVRILESDLPEKTVMFRSGASRRVAVEMLLVGGAKTRGAGVCVVQLGQERGAAAGRFNFGILVSGLTVDEIESILEEEFTVTRWGKGTEWWK